MADRALELRDEPAYLSRSGHTAPPQWVFDLLRRGEGEWQDRGDGFSVRLIDGGGLALASVIVANARGLGASALQDAARVAYGQIAEALAHTHASSPVRFWNFIPAILEPVDDLAHRYMAFNAGRFRAYEDWYQGGSSSFHRTIATASGVGHTGGELVIHCLAANEPGAPVENPRQVPSYRYSARYGPLPPCFARATRLAVNGEPHPRLLVGGTASICGECSAHPGDFDAQASETLLNLAALVGAARSEVAGDAAELGQSELLGLFRFLRIYHPRPEHRLLVSRLVSDRFGGVEEVEIVQADLCRSQLLVEIEGVAELRTS